MDRVVEGEDVLRNENWDDGRGGERGGGISNGSSSSSSSGERSQMTGSGTLWT